MHFWPLHVIVSTLTIEDIYVCVSIHAFKGSLKKRDFSVFAVEGGSVPMACGFALEGKPETKKSGQTPNVFKNIVLFCRPEFSTVSSVCKIRLTGTWIA